MIKITDVNYIDLEKKITEVKDVHIPSNINMEIDGRNKYILPGLVDMHTHIMPNSAKYYLYSGVTSIRNTSGNYELIEHIASVSPKVYATIDSSMEILDCGDRVLLEIFLRMTLI